MLFRTRGGTAALTLFAAAAALVASVSGASCATQGKGTNETFSDGSADGTQEEASGSSSGTSGSSSGSSSGGGAGCDADTAGDPFNCGSCGHKCPSGDICNCGQCFAQCGGGMATCCSGCADLMTDPQNCGTCSNACTNGGTGKISGTPVCAGGQCAFTCPDAGPEGGTVIGCGLDSGTGGCFDPSNSPQACGGCGNVCASGSCVNGVCQDASTSTTGYSISTPNVPFIDACSLPNSHTALQSSFGWTMSSVQFLPFSFSFFTTAETEFWIGSQGTLGFGNQMTAFGMPDGFPSCMGIPDPSLNYPAIVVFGDTNLNTTASGVCWAQTGMPDAGGGDAGPPDQLVVTWEQATDSTEPGSVLTFSIVLTQGTNTIDFQYGTMLSAPDGGSDPTVAGGTSSVGMQLSKTQYLIYQCNSAFITQTPLDVRFTPQ